MQMKFVVTVSTNKKNANALDVSIQRPAKVAKKWGALALLTHCGIMKGLQEAYKIANGELRVENVKEDNTCKE